LDRVSRTLYKKYNILHRDISPGNVLIVQSTSTPGSVLQGLNMCFSEYLLKSDPKYVA